MGVQPLNTALVRWEAKCACRIEKVQSRSEQQQVALGGHKAENQLGVLIVPFRSARTGALRVTETTYQ